MTTVHAYTSSQQLIDGPSKDFRRGRAGAANMLPASTGAALATTKALPALAGKFDGVAIRVPIPVGSIADVTAVTTPQAAILAVGEAVRQPVVREDRVAVATTMTLTLSIDHRAVDGATAAGFLARLRELIEEPLDIVL